MKKNLFYLVIALLLTSITANASSDIKTVRDKVAGMTETQREERLSQIQQRAEEIKAMDKTTLSKIERKELKNELKDMNKEAKAIRRGGIYISFAGLIIIILLLIIIL